MYGRQTQYWKITPYIKKQHGFQKGKSTENAISNTVNKIEKHILNNEHGMGVFLDIQAAFDSIMPKHIRNALIKHGCPVDMVEWYYEFLIHRNLETTYENFILSITMDMGFPQGGVCSAKFWIIAFEEAAAILNSSGVTGELFADDGNGLIGGKDIEYMAQRINRVCRNLSRWGKKCELTFNASKTIVTLFTKSNKIKNEYNNKSLVKMDGTYTFFKHCKISWDALGLQTNMDTSPRRKDDRM